MASQVRVEELLREAELRAEESEKRRLEERQRADKEHQRAEIEQQRAQRSGSGPTRLRGGLGALRSRSKEINLPLPRPQSPIQ